MSMTPARALSRAARLWPAADLGSVAVEYAMMLPYLALFCYGLLEVSHFAYLRMSIADVAHDAVRYAIVHSSISAAPMSSTGVTTYATNEMSGFGLSTALATITVTYNSSNVPGNTVNVSISYTFTPFMPGFNTLPGTTKTFTDLVGPITASSQMIIGP